jgi:hypothetical protein
LTGPEYFALQQDTVEYQSIIALSFSNDIISVD